MKKSLNKQKYSYSTYGLNIHSDLEIPELVPARVVPDVDIGIGILSNSIIQDELETAQVFEKPGCVVKVTVNAFCYKWKDIGSIYIRDGRTVIVEPKPGVNSSELSPFILGTVLPVLLHQRGSLVLHASAVDINGACVAFIGDKGAGKSTFAAYLQTKGHRLITDDIVPVSFGNGVQVVPGYPRIRLWADTLESFGVNPESLPRVASFMDKRTYECQGNFSLEPVQLKCIYVLTQGNELKFTEKPLSSAFIGTTRHTYLSRYLQATNRISAHFEQCQNLVQAVPFFKLERPFIFDLLPEVVSGVENHVKEITNLPHLPMTNDLVSQTKSESPTINGLTKT